jgi:hypothetical protein
VASLGVRPTVEDSGRVLLEVHIFDFAQNCYGKQVRVEFLQKMRDEEKYIDLPTLTAAIDNDAPSPAPSSPSAPPTEFDRAISYERRLHRTPE